MNNVVECLYTRQFYLSLYNQLKQARKTMMIDEGGTLWHINDLKPMFEDKPKNAVNQ